MRNRSFHEEFFVDVVVPQLVDDNTAATAWLAMTDSVRACAILVVGATDTTVDAKWEQATDSSGTGAKDVTGAAITQMAGTDDNKYKSVDLETSQMDHKDGFVYGRFKITVGNGTTGGNICAVVLRTARHNPPTQAAAYAEKVVAAG